MRTNCKKLLKVIIAVLLSCCLVASFASCKKKNNDSTPPTGDYTSPVEGSLVVDTTDFASEDGTYILSLAAGQTYTLSVSSDNAITYNASSPLIASVDKNGVITAKSSGTSVVYISSGSETKSVVVDVQSVTVPYVTVDKSSIRISSGSAGNVYQLSPEVSFEGKAVEGTVSYSSTDSAVATVSESGRITAVAAGECDIIIAAVYRDLTANCVVHVVVESI